MVIKSENTTMPQTVPSENHLLKIAGLNYNCEKWNH